MPRDRESERQERTVSNGIAMAARIPRTVPGVVEAGTTTTQPDPTTEGTDHDAEHDSARPGEGRFRPRPQRGRGDRERHLPRQLGPGPAVRQLQGRPLRSPRARCRPGGRLRGIMENATQRRRVFVSGQLVEYWEDPDVVFGWAREDL